MNDLRKQFSAIVDRLESEHRSRENKAYIDPDLAELKDENKYRERKESVGDQTVQNHYIAEFVTDGRTLGLTFADEGWKNGGLLEYDNQGFLSGCGVARPLPIC